MEDTLERAKSQVELRKKYELIKSGSPSMTEEVLSAAMMQGRAKPSKYVAKMIDYVQAHYAEVLYQHFQKIRQLHPQSVPGAFQQGIEVFHCLITAAIIGSFFPRGSLYISIC